MFKYDIHIVVCQNFVIIRKKYINYFFGSPNLSLPFYTLEDLNPHLSVKK